MPDTPNSEETQEVTWSAPMEILPPQELTTRPQRLVKVALLLSAFSLLVAGYSVLQNVNNQNSSVTSNGESGDVDDIDLFYPPKDLPGLILKVEESVVAIECESKEKDEIGRAHV